MATLAQIILFIACAYCVHGGILRRIHKHLDDFHLHQTTAKTYARDNDAVIFPKDNDADNVHITGNDETIAKDVNIKAEDIVTPLISKMIPEVQAKDVFTNPVPEKTTVTDKIVDDDDTTELTKKPEDFVERKAEGINDLRIENLDSNNERLAIIVNKTLSNLNETVPDFSSRFGGSDNYMLVPVAANVQTFQPVQANSNVIPTTNLQGNPAYLTSINSNNQLLTTTPNVGANVHYTVPNGASNIGTNIQPASVGTNVGPIQSATNNVNYVAPGNPNSYVNVPNTYMINGQLYAAVTVPNGNVPNTLYYVNPQVSYQVPNNLPLYKLVTLNGNQVLQNQNTQYVSK